MHLILLDQLLFIQQDNDTNFHLHARIPGLNFFNLNEKVIIITDPKQIFVFKQ